MMKLLLLLLLVMIVGCGDMTTVVTMETNKGVIKIELFTEQAPITTKNFIDLIGDEFYDGLSFHRYAELSPGAFIIQGGDPSGDGTGGSGKQIPLEVDPSLKHEKGTLSMARAADPNSASSQFFIASGPVPHLDGNYAIFGKVIEGMDIALSLREGDRMVKVTVS